MNVVSFDFDGVLHLDVNGGGDPRDPFSADMNPNPIMIKRMMDEHAKGREIWIVSARSNTDSIWRFVKKNNLPVFDVIGTHGRDKSEDLRSIGAFRHYDDKAYWADDISPKDNIQIVIVNPGDTPPSLRELDDAFKKSKKVNRNKRKSAVMEAIQVFCEEPPHERKIR
jgi:hypothetical protein